MDMKNLWTKGFAAEERERAQLWIWEEGGVYSLGAGGGGGSWMEVTKMKCQGEEVPVNTTWQDTCWRQARVIWREGGR